MSRLETLTGTKGSRSLLSRLVSPTGTNGPCPPAGPASRWIRDKSQLLSWAQRLPGQMAWNKDLFCSSEPSFAERKNLRIQGVKRQIVLLIIDLCVTLFIEIKPVVLPRCHASLFFPPLSPSCSLFYRSESPNC